MCSRQLHCVRVCAISASPKVDRIGGGNDSKHCHWLVKCCTATSPVPRPDPPEKEGPGIHCLRMTTVLYPCNQDVELWISLIGPHNFPGSNNGVQQYFNHTLFFALQMLDSPGMHLKPEQVASISAIYNGKDVFIWLPTGFGKSVCYKTTPFLTETILFVMDFKGSIAPVPV